MKKETSNYGALSDQMCIIWEEENSIEKEDENRRNGSKQTPWSSQINKACHTMYNKYQEIIFRQQFTAIF